MISQCQYKLRRPCFNAVSWTLELTSCAVCRYYQLKYKSTHVNITFYRCMDKDYETNFIGLVTIWGISSI